MEASWIVYFQYRLQHNDDNLFEAHLKSSKDRYCQERKVGEMYSPPMLDMATLNHEAWLFKWAAKANDVDVMPIIINPLMHL